MEQIANPSERTVEELRTLAIALIRQLSEEDCRQILAMLASRAG